MFRTPIIYLSFVLLVLTMLLPGSLQAQSLVPGSAAYKENTAYPTFPVNDPIYFFCTQEGSDIGSLTAKSAGATVSFLWEKFDSVTLKFGSFSNETGTTSTINRLANGCYRVSFTENGQNFQFRAWVLNDWSKPVASIAESTCTNLRLASSVTGSSYQYYDLASGKVVVISSDYTYRWYVGTQYLSSIQNPNILQPPSQNTVYRVEVTDRAGCMKSAEVSYTSPIPVAKFSWTTPQQNDPQYSFPQAPADIDFKNLSQNSDAGKYEWYLFKDKNILGSMGGGTAVIDSFQAVLYDDNPLYTYELSGKYKVKLVASKTVQDLTCRDTFYLPDYIIVDTSLVKVSPVFTPNGDGVNDKMIIKTRSLESLDLTVLNRWGKVVHHFSSNNYIPAESEIAAWDGRVNGNLLPAGVYFYVVDAQGRDGVRRRLKGFVEMIW
ncbi:MAG: gliding motility-associated C-terminal domain-containing protein [Prolixibacteraceae bacterium]|nr:gliding motility-associated C-terminal domain-containing protein [Prolixibacteraceae bacterium]